MKRALTSRPQNPLTISIASDGTGDEILTARLSTYLRKHPKTDVDVIDASGSEVVRLLSDRKVDLGVAVLLPLVLTQFAPIPSRQKRGSS